jgi:hypothetical protein
MMDELLAFVKVGSGFNRKKKPNDVKLPFLVKIMGVIKKKKLVKKLISFNIFDSPYIVINYHTSKKSNNRG